MKKVLHIGKIFIKKNDSKLFNGSVKLCSEITMLLNEKKLKKVCYFEFDSKYERFLCYENSDAFVIGLLITAMENGLDIEFETPLSEKLYYQLTNYYIPMLSKYNRNYSLHCINLIGKTNNFYFKNEAVATGCSGGVDSFYTIAKHMNKNLGNFKLTHLVYSSSGTADIVQDRIESTFKKNRELVRNICNDCNLEFIDCFNNLNEFYKFPYEGFNMFFTTIFGSVAFAIQKLIKIYYCSSGAPIENFNIDVSKTNGFDGSAIDIFTVLCMNNQNVSFYSSGVEKNRNEKIEYISEFKPAQKNLMVCGIEAYGGKIEKSINCSNCKKCLRTMFSLYAINKLEKFKNVFDVVDFKKNLNKKIARVLYIDHSDFTKITIKKAKLNKVWIPKSSYFIGFFKYKPIAFLKKYFKNSKIARKIYYKLKLDIKVNGFRGSSYESFENTK